MDEGKVTAMQSWPIPTSIKELQRFLGFANFYRRFIQNYSSIAGPLTDLLKHKPKSLSWTRSATESFNILKETFITAPILVHPDPDKAFVVEVDASTTGVGAVLSAPEEDSQEPEPILPEDMILCPIQWALESILTPSVSTSEPPGCPPGLQYVPRKQRTPIIHSAHSSLGTGHPGANGTLSLLKDSFWWPNMARDVRRFVQGCSDCAISKSPHHFPSGKLLPLPVPTRPWSHLGVDLITDLPPSNGNTCILVIVDRFSKSCRFIPLKGLPTAIETAENLFNQVFRYFGIREDIVSDRGSDPNSFPVSGKLSPS